MISASEQEGGPPWQANRPPVEEEVDYDLHLGVNNQTLSSTEVDGDANANPPTVRRLSGQGVRAAVRRLSGGNSRWRTPETRRSSGGETPSSRLGEVRMAVIRRFSHEGRSADDNDDKFVDDEATALSTSVRTKDTADTDNNSAGGRQRHVGQTPQDSAFHRNSNDVSEPSYVAADHDDADDDNASATSATLRMFDDDANNSASRQSLGIRRGLKVAYCILVLFAISFALIVSLSVFFLNKPSNETGTNTADRESDDSELNVNVTDEDDNGTVVVVPAAPDSIAYLCSEANIKRTGGLNQCKHLCQAADCCYDNEQCYGVNMVTCLGYEGFCDFLYGTMAKPPWPTLPPGEGVPRAPGNIQDVCHHAAVVTAEGNERCFQACSTGWCCFPTQLATVASIPNDDGSRESSCFDGNEAECGGYTPCLALTSSSAPTPSGDLGPSQSIPVPSANLTVLCSTSSTLTTDGMIRCYEACLPGLCCGYANATQSCFEQNEEICGWYGPCQILRDAGSDYIRSANNSIPPEPSVDLGELCSYDSLILDKSNCENVCKGGQCCLDGTCQDQYPELCLRYQTCTNLHPLPDPPANLSTVCSMDYVHDGDRMDDCQELCHISLCCTAEGPASCFRYHERTCGLYNPCRVLYREENKDVPTVVQFPQINLESVCSSGSSTGGAVGGEVCESACQAGSCCFHPDPTSNCYQENEESCGHYGPCLLLVDGADDVEFVSVPPPTEGGVVSGEIDGDVVPVSPNEMGSGLDDDFPNQ